MDPKFMLIPDSSKRTLNSSQICAVMDEKTKKHFLDSRTTSIPVADGRKGSVDASITAVSGIKEYVTTKNPYSGDVESRFGLIDGGQTAVVEMASCAGLPLVEDRKDPRLTTTYGVGQPILAATDKEVKKVTVGLRGSSVGGDGCSAAAAAGIRFYDKGGGEFIPTGEATADIDRIDLSGRDSLLEQVKIVTMYNIGDPIYGPVGTFFIFSPQKGANEATVLQLDKRIRNLSRAIAQTTSADISRMPGTGATGVMGAGMITSFGPRPQMGVQTVLNAVRFDEVIGGTDYILADEGKLDSQNLRGKVVTGTAEKVGKWARAMIAAVGEADDNEVRKVYDMDITTVLLISKFPQGSSVNRHRSQEDLACTIDNTVRLIKAEQREH